MAVALFFAMKPLPLMGLVGGGLTFSLLLLVLVAAAILSSSMLLPLQAKEVGLFSSLPVPSLLQEVEAVPSSLLLVKVVEVVPSS